MEPLDDQELKQLLREWTSPPVPPGLESPWKRQRPLSDWLRGSIAVPVPVGVAALFALLAYLAWSVAGGPPPAPASVPDAGETESAVISLSGFRTVPEIAPQRMGELE